MDFGALPPEVNSARMYAGPGSAPMLAAATAWAGLAAELGSTAALYESVISGLTSDGWTGPASASMAAAAAPYVQWITMTGAQAEQTSAQAAAAAGAYEAAYAMTVHPAEIAANRALLAALVATNVLGQNTAAIAAAEAQYGEMWAQDAAAMYGYAGSSATASNLLPFDQPEQIANPAGIAGQASTMSQVMSTAAGTGSQQIQQLISAIPTALQGLSSPVAAANPAASIPGLGFLDAILNFLDGADGNAIGTFLNSSFANGFVSAGYVSPAVIEPAVTAGMADINAVAVAAAPDATALPPMGSGSGNALWTPIAGAAGLTTPFGADGLGTASAVMPSGVGGISGGTSQAALVGRLSVPQAWTAATSVANHAGTALPGGGWTSSAPVPNAAGGMPGVPGMPAPGAAGSFAHGPRYGFRPTIMARPPAAG
ncbi:MAG: PPE family protein [Mycobacterium sp.]